MNIVSEHRIQSIFIVIESVVLVYGILSTATLIKVATRVGAASPAYAYQFRDFGFFLFLIPVGWAWWTIHLQRHDHHWADEITVVTAWASLIAVVFFVVKAVEAASLF